MQDVTLKITDRNGKLHTIEAPTDMAMNIMEVVKAYEIEDEASNWSLLGEWLCVHLVSVMLILNMIYLKKLMMKKQC